ncbi:MAG: Gfo/Idh/MocA family oxidoreductase [Lentisphaerae bacterium]|nr:Gfo/Idh/MocA family oxidoreductase [Lentisphaerota bacterium]
MKRVKLGIIGCGAIGTGAHLPAAQKSKFIETIAVADIIEERANAAAEKFSVPQVYNSGSALLKEADVDAVVLALPVGDRSPLAFEALKLNKHVLLEKPVAANAREVKRMINLRGDKVVGVCSSRYALEEMSVAARKCVESGVLGDLRIVRARELRSVSAAPNPNPPAWRQSMAKNGGGILVNWSCYELDLLMSITGWKLKPTSVMGQWWPVATKQSAYVAPGSDADSHYTALVVCEGGTVISLERAEFAVVQHDQSWEIIGTDASLIIPMLAPSNRPYELVLNRIVKGKGIVPKTIWKPKKTVKNIDVLEDFVKAILENNEPKTGLEQSLILQNITDAIYKSAKTGKLVSIKQ